MEKLHLKVDRQLKQLGKWITYETQEWIGTLEQMRTEQSTRVIIGAIKVEDIQNGVMFTRKTGDYERELIELKEVK